MKGNRKEKNGLFFHTYVFQSLLCKFKYAAIMMNYVWSIAIKSFSPINFLSGLKFDFRWDSQLMSHVRRVYFIVKWDLIHWSSSYIKHKSYFIMDFNEIWYRDTAGWTVKQSILPISRIYGILSNVTPICGKHNEYFLYIHFYNCYCVIINNSTFFKLYNSF